MATNFVEIYICLTSHFMRITSVLYKPTELLVNAMIKSVYIMLTSTYTSHLNIYQKYTFLMPPFPS